MCSWECDGLCVANPDIDPNDESAGLEWRANVLDLIWARANIPVAIKEPMQMYELLAELRPMKAIWGEVGGVRLAVPAQWDLGRF